MEYPFSDMSALPVMGKYDIAALRFGYNREVELTDGTVESGVATVAELKKKLAKDKKEMKAYGYCTDEHTGANPDCNRFDEGITLPEITQVLLQTADERYKRSSFKLGRRYFSANRDLESIAGAADIMEHFRVQFEQYAGFQKKFNLSPDDWEQDDFLNEINTGVLMGAQYMLDRLIEHDDVCGYVNVDKPKSLRVINLRTLPFGARVADCFDPRALIGLANRDKLRVVGQAGKSLIDRKSSENPNAYVDQIDVKGIYGEKLMAINFLLTRQIGSSIFDDPESFSFLQHHQVRPVLIQVLDDILLNQVTKEAVFKNQAGLTVAKGDFKQDWDDTHELPVPIDDRVRDIFGLTSNAPFTKSVSEMIASLIPDTSDRAGSSEDLEHFAVRTSVPNGSSVDVKVDGKDPDFISVKVAGNFFYASKENVVATKAIEGIRIRDITDKLSPEQLDAIDALLQDPAADSSKLKPDELAAYNLGAEKLEAAINDDIASAKHFKNLLFVLPKL
jgi:hypothetical protein